MALNGKTINPTSQERWGLSMEKAGLGSTNTGILYETVDHRCTVGEKNILLLEE
jgi:hypothetical protein